MTYINKLHAKVRIAELALEHIKSFDGRVNYSQSDDQFDLIDVIHRATMALEEFKSVDES